MFDLKKCRRCRFYCVRMTGEKGNGFNPFPSCYYYEITGKRPNILEPERCFQPRKMGVKINV